MRRKNAADRFNQLAELLLSGAWIKELYFDGKVLKWTVLIVDDEPKPKG